MAYVKHLLSPFAPSQVGMLQFKDLNADKTAFQRTYVNQARGGSGGK